MEKLISNLSDEQYERTSEKFFEFNAFKKQQQILQSNLIQNKDLFTLYSIHHEFRSPWVLNHPQKKARIDKIFAEKNPEKDHIENYNNKPVIDFINDFYSNRENSITTFMNCDPRNIRSMEFHSCNVNSDVFLATFVIPALFGHFLGSENVKSFIEAVGCGFDICLNNESDFISRFPKTFLYLVLRQFFFSPVFRSFYGEQFTCFLDLFAHVHHQIDSQFAKVQRFFNAFLIEFKEVLKSSSCPFIQSLFIRISNGFKNKKALLLTVLFHCLILPMAEDPISYGVLPLNYDLHETDEVAQKLKIFYELAFSHRETDNLTPMFRQVNDDNYKKPSKEKESQTPKNKISLKRTTLIGRSSSDYFFNPSSTSLLKRRSISGPGLNSKEIHNIDMKLVDSFIDTALQAVPNQTNWPGINSFVLPYRALVYLLEYFNFYDPNSENDKSSNFQSFTIIKIDVSIPSFLLNSNEVKTEEEKVKSKELEMLITLFDLDDPDSPQGRVLKKQFELLSKSSKNFDINSIISEIEQYTESLLLKITETQGMIHVMQKFINLYKESLMQANSIFINQIVDSMMNDFTFSNDLRQNKSSMLADPDAFSSFVVSHLDLFAQKNKWASPFMRQIAQKFHSKLTTNNFSLHDFILNAEKNASNSNDTNSNDNSKLSQYDQKFLNNKMIVLSLLEQNGLDENVKKILNCKDSFDAAQTIILRSCLLENPIESAKQIVLSLNTVEDIFLFVFGVRPEANQLMPLLANLFIISPVPTPLSFAQWLKHFLKNLMEIKQEWFSDESLRPLEHYFTFGSWMRELLMSIQE